MFLCSRCLLVSIGFWIVYNLWVNIDTRNGCRWRMSRYIHSNGMRNWGVGPGMWFLLIYLIYATYCNFREFLELLLQLFVDRTLDSIVSTFYILSIPSLKSNPTWLNSLNCIYSYHTFSSICWYWYFMYWYRNFEFQLCFNDIRD